MYKSVPLTEKRPRRQKTGIKDKLNFEEMEHEFPFGTFCQEKQDYLSHAPLLPEIFRCNDPKSHHVPFIFQPVFRKLFENGKQPQGLPLFSLNVCEATCKRHCQLQEHTKGEKFGAKHAHLCGFCIDVSFFSYVKKKHCSRF